MIRHIFMLRNERRVSPQIRKTYLKTGNKQLQWLKKKKKRPMLTKDYAAINEYIYIYMCMCVCFCVCTLAREILSNIPSSCLQSKDHL